MQNHNEYLRQIEFFLTDLSVMERAKLLSEINSEISDKELSDLQSPLLIANQKRAEHGFVPFLEKKKFSFMSLFLKVSAIMAILFVGSLSFLVWKFTPILKIDEENNRVTILGGLIDIDGEAGKFKIFDEYHFSKDSFNNDLQANIALDQDKDEIIVKFKSGSFTLKNSEDSEFKLDCKLAKPAQKDVIKQVDDYIKIDLSQISGATCELGIPEDKKITLDGDQSHIKIITPIFNSYIDIDSGKVSITPEEEIDYLYNLEVKNGYVGEFESSESEDSYEIQININNGSIITK
jgi:hypothetical protein